MKGDAAFGEVRELSALPRALVERLEHYFLTYKRPPGAAGVSETPITDAGLYGRAEACEVIERSREDYRILFPDLRGRLLASLRSG
jgi:inorganic pyrophosphatase